MSHPTTHRARSVVAALNFRRGLPPWWIEVIIVGAGYLLYQAVQILVTGSEESAIDRAEWIWTVQKMLHINPEIVVNQWVANNDFLVYATGYFYGIAHFAITPLVLIWIRVYRKNDYALLRNVLIGSSLVALLMYWIVPLAPPRLSMTQIVDTLRVENILSAADPTGPASMANQYAAMPSLHVAWAVWVALALYVAFRPHPWRLAFWLYPALTTFVVIGTGNHFVLDAVAGAMVVWLAWFVASRVHTTMCPREEMTPISCVETSLP
ncbi:MAG: phosphatase PAP2 family protein [Candidatus Nanopelagicales bacterium]|nr:phosphatase PAP2 family protein [Candidatus Nanopelagicales bacterium]